MKKKPGTKQQASQEEVLMTKNISFTGNAIDQLSPSQTAINLDEWIWHEEIINGEKFYVVTDRIIPNRVHKE